jgi:hypothetical protein
MLVFKNYDLIVVMKTASVLFWVITQRIVGITQKSAVLSYFAAEA